MILIWNYFQLRQFDEVYRSNEFLILYYIILHIVRPSIIQNYFKLYESMKLTIQNRKKTF
jgi:hypothetical protein